MCLDLDCDGDADMCCCCLPLSLLLALCCCRDFGRRDRYAGYAVPTATYVQPGAYPAYYPNQPPVYAAAPMPAGAFFQQQEATYAYPVYPARRY